MTSPRGCSARLWAFLAKEGGLGAEIMCAMANEIESLCLVKECRELEASYGTCTDEILKDAGASPYDDPGGN